MQATETPAANAAPTKWTAGEIGPRQAKAFDEAVSAYHWAARTITELLDSGPYSVTPMVGGSGNPQAAPLMAEIMAKYDGTVTAKNYQAIIADIQAAAIKLKDTRPTIDRRTTPEQRAERERIAAEREAKRSAASNLERAQTQKGPIFGSGFFIAFSTKQKRYAQPTAGRQVYGGSTLAAPVPRHHHARRSL